MDRKGNVKQGTHLIFNVSPDFELHGEGAQNLIPTQLCWARPDILLGWHDQDELLFSVPEQSLESISSQSCRQFSLCCVCN